VLSMQIERAVAEEGTANSEAREQRPKTTLRDERGNNFSHRRRAPYRLAESSRRFKRRRLSPGASIGEQRDWDDKEMLPRRPQSERKDVKLADW